MFPSEPSEYAAFRSYSRNMLHFVSNRSNMLTKRDSFAVTTKTNVLFFVRKVKRANFRNTRRAQWEKIGASAGRNL